ncbi:MAG: alpha/beta fold hydrolase [Opitutaceae bacterium]
MKVPRLLWGCLAVVLLASWAGSRVQSAGGAVQVRGLVLPAGNGQWIAADLFRPRTATAARPAPLVVVVPGFQRSKETQANISLELARRGVVVIALDPSAQGGSSASLSTRAATEEGYGLFAVIDYAATGVLNYVDRSRMAATGHSAGGNAALQAASHFGREAERTGTPSKLHAVFISGYVLTLTERTLRPVRSHLGISYALHDEGAYRNELGHGDLRRAPEALRAVRSGLGAAGRDLAEIEPGRFYGSEADRTLRVVYNEPLLHPFQPYSVEATANQLEFFIRTLGLKEVPAPRDQVWYWKDLCGLLALAAALTALVPLARWLLAAVPAFATLVRPVPPALPPPAGAGRVVLWALLGSGAVIAGVSYIPLAEWSQRLFPEASGRTLTWFFPQRMNNALMLWAFVNGIVGFALFLLGRRLRRERPAADAADPVWRVSAAELARTALFALLLWGAFFLLLAGIHAVFHVDYRFLFFGARPIGPSIVALLPMYAPAFLVFFLGNSLRVNAALRFAGEPEWRSLLRAGLANSLGLLLILGVQYATFAATGTVRWTEGWLYVNLLFAVVPIMFLLPYFNRFFFRLTGRIYLGPLTMVLIFITVLLSNTVCYLPF